MAQIKLNATYGVTGTIPTANIADDAITSAKIADNAVVTAGINADAITDAKIADDVIGTEHFTAGEVDQTAIANQAINEAKIQISNAPTNGQFLSAQSGNTGGMTWATVGTTWESKTSAFNGANGKGYFVDTSSAAITATLPASPSVGDEIRFIDVSATFDTNNLTVARNGKKIQGATSDLTVATERAGLGLVFSGDTNGWLLIEK